MYNAKYIIPGVLIAVVAFTSPFWLNLGGKTYVYPEVALPTGEGKDKCIESKEWMRAEHMALLNTWRDEAIREGKREYVATDGRKWSSASGYVHGLPYEQGRLLRQVPQQQQR